MKRQTRAATIRRTLAGGALLLSLTGCALTAPPTVLEPYEASSGVSADLTDDLLVRGLVVVSPGQGRPGELVGAIVNRTDRPAVVQIQADPDETSMPTQSRVTVPAGGSVRLGPQGESRVTLASVPKAPGGNLALSVATPSAGAETLSVPIVLPEGPFASHGPALGRRGNGGALVGTPSPTSTPRSTRAGSDEDPAADAASPAPTDAVPGAEPEASPTDES